MWSKFVEVLNPYEALKEYAQQERSKKYNCDGMCYTDTSMCPRAEVCPETRRSEFWATISAALIIFIAIPIAVVTAIICLMLICSH